MQKYRDFIANNDGLKNLKILKNTYPIKKGLNQTIKHYNNDIQNRWKKN